MKYKAVISDIDGTLTPIELGTLPTDTVSKRIKELLDAGVHFSLASGRPFFLIEDVVKHLGLVDPSITDNGAVIMDSVNKKVLWQSVLSSDEAMNIVRIASKYGFTRASCDIGGFDNPASIDHSANVRKVSVHDLTPQAADDLIDEVERLYKNLAISKAASYKGEAFMDVYFSNANATKQRAVLEYAKMLNITPDEIIGVGDGYNDYPLLMACGFKVAMGNSVDELKEIADYIAPDVANDGLADVIERFALSSS